ncbi:uncharacterized protein LOC143597558 [Bidens hawaiensis]|uniref:uncharacterized protein LOC143597558 n=1 Tax=Bidens hawaiensis TaxID=980011 RepID=UPI004049DCE5
MEWFTDRTWMYKRTNSDGSSSLEFYNNLNKWVTKKRKTILDIKCPCLKCQNGIYKDRETVQKHLLMKGFMPLYYTWSEHGEESTHNAGHSSATMEVVGDDNDGCRQMVLDSMYSSGYDPTTHLNHDSNTFEGDAPNSEANGFYDMLQAADEPLWDGEKGTHCSKLQSATSFLNWKSLYNVSTECYNHNISMVKALLPKGNKLPENFYDTKKSLEKLCLPKERIDVCKNHCMLFYKQDKTLTQCKWCGESRHKSGQNKVPHLVMTNIPIGPRLKKLYMTIKTAKDMTWHHDHKTKDGIMSHPSDGKAWKHFDSKNPDFANEIRNVRLGLCTDGFNPNNTNSNPYSLWPVFLTIYNLPPWMCMKDSFVKLCLVIPGRKSPNQNLDVFLRPLIDELKELYEEGLEVYDAYRKENFTMKAILLWTVSDFPAYAMLSGWSTHGHLDCPYCMGDTESFRLQAGRKASWFDCHRRFLPPSHPFRRDKDGFRANKSIPPSFGPPVELDGWKIYEQVYDIPSVYEGAPYNTKDRLSEFGKTHNWVKRSIFWELEYWPMLLIRHNLDVLHIEKNVFENPFQTVMDTDKTKDNINARVDLKEICNRPSLHTWEAGNNKYKKPKASYTLTKDQVNEVMNCPGKEHLKDIAQEPLTFVQSHKGYLVDGYKFHTQTSRVTQNSGVCVKGASYNGIETDYYGMLDEILEVEYHSRLGSCVVVLFKCTWFDPVKGVRVDPKTNMVDVKPKAIGCVDDPCILASQAQKVYYTPYPSKEKRLKDWWAVVKTTPRGVYALAEDSSEVGDEDNEDEEHFFQDNERLVCTSTNDLLPITHIQGNIIEEVNDISDDDREQATFEDADLDDDDDDDDDDNAEEFEYED